MKGPGSSVRSPRAPAGSRGWRRPACRYSVTLYWVDGPSTEAKPWISTDGEASRLRDDGDQLALFPVQQFGGVEAEVHGGPGYRFGVRGGAGEGQHGCGRDVGRGRWAGPAQHRPHAAHRRGRRCRALRPGWRPRRPARRGGRRSRPSAVLGDGPASEVAGAAGLPACCTTCAKLVRDQMPTVCGARPVSPGGERDVLADCPRGRGDVEDCGGGCGVGVYPYPAEVMPEPGLEVGPQLWVEGLSRGCEHGVHAGGCPVRCRVHRRAGGCRRGRRCQGAGRARPPHRRTTWRPTSALGVIREDSLGSGRHLSTPRRLPTPGPPSCQWPSGSAVMDVVADRQRPMPDPFPRCSAAVEVTPCPPTTSRSGPRWWPLRGLSPARRHAVTAPSPRGRDVTETPQPADWPVGAGKCVTSCDLRIFLDQAA